LGAAPSSGKQLRKQPVVNIPLEHQAEAPRHKPDERSLYDKRPADETIRSADKFHDVYFAPAHEDRYFYGIGYKEKRHEDENDKKDYPDAVDDPADIRQLLRHGRIVADVFHPVYFGEILHRAGVFAHVVDGDAVGVGVGVVALEAGKELGLVAQRLFGVFQRLLLRDEGDAFHVRHSLYFILHRLKARLIDAVLEIDHYLIFALHLADEHLDILGKKIRAAQKQQAYREHADRCSGDKAVGSYVPETLPEKIAQFFHHSAPSGVSLPGVSSAISPPSMVITRW
jgi:hypothetical protein